MNCETITAVIFNYFMNCVRNILVIAFGQNNDKKFDACVERAKLMLNYSRLIKIYLICRYICEALNERRLHLFNSVTPRHCTVLNAEHVKNKCVVITDCDFDYGREIAVVMVKNGANVIVGCNDKDTKDWSLALLAQLNITGYIRTLTLDMTSQQSIEEFASVVLRNFQTIDILICNACYLSKTNVRQLTQGFGGHRQFGKYLKGIDTVLGNERHFAANHLGNFVLTYLLLDRLKASTDARVIVESSASYIFATIGTNNFENICLGVNYATANAFFQSKLANILFAREFARRVTTGNESHSNIKIFSVDSRDIKSKLGLFCAMGLPFIERLLFMLYYPVYYYRPEQAAKTTLYCALDTSVALRSGDFYRNCRRVETFTSDSMATQLWNLSCYLAKIDFNL